MERYFTYYKLYLINTIVLLVYSNCCAAITTIQFQDIFIPSKTNPVPIKSHSWFLLPFLFDNH